MRSSGEDTFTSVREPLTIRIDHVRCMVYPDSTTNALLCVALACTAATVGGVCEDSYRRSQSQCHVSVSILKVLHGGILCLSELPSQTPYTPEHHPNRPSTAARFEGGITLRRCRCRLRPLLWQKSGHAKGRRQCEVRSSRHRRVQQVSKLVTECMQGADSVLAASVIPLQRQARRETQGVRHGWSA